MKLCCTAVCSGRARTWQSSGQSSGLAQICSLKEEQLPILAIDTESCTGLLPKAPCPGPGPQAVSCSGDDLHCVLDRALLQGCIDEMPPWFQHIPSIRVLMWQENMVIKS